MCLKTDTILLQYTYILYTYTLIQYTYTFNFYNNIPMYGGNVSVK